MTMDDCIFIENEVYRINADTAQGEQSIMVQKDMKKWAVENGAWGSEHYSIIVKKHAEACGWTQKGLTGMEILG
jgi:hypothetical protein